MSALSRRAVAGQLHSLRSEVAAAGVRIRRALIGGPRLLRVMLVSDQAAYTSEQQFAPILRHASALRRQLGVVAQHRPLARGMKLQRSVMESVDVLGLKLSFRTPAGEAERITRHFRSTLQGTATKFVYFDGDDDVCIQWPEVLRQVDCYVKKHVFADPQAYSKRYSGKSNLTDYVVHEHGRSFEDDIIPASGPVDPVKLAKLHLGWNIGLDDKIADLARTTSPQSAQEKDIDIGSRAFVAPEVWIHPLRDQVVDRIDAMASRFRVLAPRERVSQEQYYHELQRARICVSPYGYGELCWRDFEAVLCGCLVVKPNMGHLRTYPDIFVPDETYAPVRWDYSDLEEVCARYLADEASRLRIADRARTLLMEALQEGAFVQRFDALLRRLGLSPSA